MKNTTSSTHLSDPFAYESQLGDSPSSTKADTQQSFVRLVCLRGARIAQAVGQIVYVRLTRGSEPMISKHCNDNGSPDYQVCDPVYNTKYRFTSEDEVRIWLDHRYYQHSDNMQCDLK